MPPKRPGQEQHEAGQKRPRPKTGIIGIIGLTKKPSSSSFNNNKKENFIIILRESKRIILLEKCFI
jgi:hypothetical protein